jgi:hypothetical protein
MISIAETFPFPVLFLHHLYRLKRYLPIVCPEDHIAICSDPEPNILADQQDDLEVASLSEDT